MKFTCYDINSQHLIYEYSDDNDKSICDYCLHKFPTGECSLKCNNGRYNYIKLENRFNTIFIFCFDGRIKTHKAAKNYAKITINSYISTKPFLLTKHQNNEKTTNLIIHNTRNLNAQINAKLLSIFNENQLIKERDKIKYIEKVISEQPTIVAREILSIIKSITQINSEYTIIDYLEGKNHLLKSDFSNHKLHTIIVLSFYLYEQDFINKQIKVSIGSTQEFVYINFNTIKTAFAQIFDNAIKYSLSNSEILITYNIIDSDYIDIIITMNSLFISDNDMIKLYTPGERGEYVDKCDSKGSGLGMGIIKKMIELNNGLFSFRRVVDRPYYINDIPYSTNEFIVKLPRRKL